VALLLSSCIGVGGMTVWDRDENGEQIEKIKMRSYVFGLAAPKIAYRDKDGYNIAASKTDAVDEVLNLAEKGITAGLAAAQGDKAL